MTICRLCETSEVESIINFGEQPIVHKLLRSKEECYEKYSFNLGYCKFCGFLQLLNYIKPEILYKNYFTISSWKYQPHVQRLIDQIDFIYHPNQNTKILEIGCNDGSFITSLIERGYENILGIEPTLDSYLIAKNKGYNVVNNFFNKEFIEKDPQYENYYDIVISRQVLEHIDNLNEFLKSIRIVLKDNGGLVIEVPDHSMNLETLDYSLWEEHINYFTKDTLNNLFQKNGFKVLHYETTLFSGKAMIFYAIKTDDFSKNIVNKNDDLIKNYIMKLPILERKLKNHLEEEAKNKKIYIYGCGARSSTFVNFFKLQEFIECYIDDQKEKQDYYVPGSLLKVNRFSEELLPNSLWLLGANTENEKKIIQCKNISKFNNEIYSILPPSKLLPNYWKDLIN